MELIPAEGNGAVARRRLPAWVWWGLAILVAAGAGVGAAKAGAFASGPNNSAVAVRLLVTPTSTPKAAPATYGLDAYVQDAVSGQPIVNAQAVYGDQRLLTNPAGEFELQGLSSGTAVSVTVTASGYVSRTVTGTIGTSTLVISPLKVVPMGQAVYSAEGGIYAVGFDGGAPRQLAASGNLNAVPSPDGSKIAFASTRDGLKDPEGESLQELYLSDSTGLAVAKVSSLVADTIQPLWSPDGAHIYFTGYTDASLAMQVYEVYDVASGTTIDIPDVASNVVFSPDGKSIAYTAYGTDSSGATIDQLKTLSLAAATPTVLATSPQEMSGVRYSADGTSISYQVMQGTALERFSVDIATQAQTPADPLVSATLRVVASPNGAHIAYVDLRDGVSSLYVANADGSDERLLSRTLSVDPLVLPQWDPGSRYVSFATGDGPTQSLYVAATAGGDPLKLADYSN